MDTVDDVNNAVIIVGHPIFDSNNKKLLPLTTESLNIILSLSEGEVIFAIFETVVYAVRYINNIEKLKIGEYCINLFYEIYLY